MYSNILAKLIVKNQPEKLNPVSVRIPEKRNDINIDVKIVDKREKVVFDRDNFFITKPPQMVQPVQEPIKATATQPLAEPVQETVKVTQPKKIKKKLRLIDDTDPELVIKIRKKKSPIGVTRVIPSGLVQIGNINIEERLPTKKPNVLIKASSYYMENREIFINFINSLFLPYKEELKIASESASCESRSDFSLMAHQKIVRDYINLYTPYRGILLYHGLGSGKTCTSISIAEGMKDGKKVIVMTPASLRRNYYEELKKCGDSMYKKNQFWEFIRDTEENINTLSSVLNLSVTYIKQNGGAWLVNVKKKSNYDTLNTEEKKSLDQQLDEMIRYKYQFISYNGLRKSHLKALTTGESGKKNPFDNTVVIIDEAHNLISRIVNKVSKKSDSVSTELYELLMTAENARIVLLSGTPIINYPNEIGILFNILRGYIKTWNLNLVIQTDQKITKKVFEELFKSTVIGGNVSDFIEYNPSNTTLSITRNPFGFGNKTTKGVYDGVRISEKGEMSDTEFIGHVKRLLSKIKVSIANIKVDMYKSMPDSLDEFKSYFIGQDNKIQNVNLFKRRILGTTSYFRSAQENLMPKYTKSSNFYIVDVEMSDFQFAAYEEARVQERKLELRNRKKKAVGNIYEESVSTYRIFSRAFCNFVFPKPDIVRPMPDIGADKDEDVDEDILDAGKRLDNIDGKYEADELQEGQQDTNYDKRIQMALDALSERKEEFLYGDALEKYSPKFKAILENIKHPDHKGLHLMYSQFRTLEGIGIFKIVLEANGFAEFTIKNTPSGWRMNVPLKDRGKPMFVLYTGTESSEQKEIVRNVFNGDWKYVPPSLETDLMSISSNNLYGEVIKVFMITASGAEGISLKNTRYVHITEPYWHPVRIEQVIGRARRICSHQELPEALRTVDVFLYLMHFSEKQLTSDATIELRLKDTSKQDGKTPFTSDQTLWEISNLKEEVTEKLLEAVKEASIDCSIHSHIGGEQLKCFSFGKVEPTKFSFSGSYTNADTDAVAQQNVKIMQLDAEEVIIQGIKYAIVRKTGDIYDWESYIMKQPIQIGKLIKTEKGYEFQRL
jgi:hypothetical protein